MIDFIAICRKRNIPYIEGGHHHTKHGWVQTHCPFCTDGQSGWHMGFSLEQGNFNCWRCGSHRAIAVLSAILHSADQAFVAMSNNRTDKRFRTPPTVDRPHEAEQPPSMGKLGTTHRKYIESRNFQLAQLKRWDLHGTYHLSGEWNWRIVFPIKNSQGQVQAYCGRSIDDDTRPKYKMTHNDKMTDDPRSLLYGIEQVGKCIVIVEGPLDVWRLGPGAVATLGVDWKPEQLKILSGIPTRYIMFDPDKNAQKKAKQLADRLSVFNGTTNIISGHETDPGEMTTRDARELMAQLGFPSIVF